MGVSTAAGHRTAFFRVGGDNQRVGAESEIRHIVGGLRNSERVVGIGGNHLAALRPVRERVACVRRGRQRGRGTVVVGACAAHITASGRVGRGRDSIAVEFEGGDEGVVVGHRYLARI